jgi:hypothetical protein
MCYRKTAIVAATIASVTAFVRFGPPYALDPFCTYDLDYRLTATIEVDGQQYTSSVTRRLSRSRRWIREMNSAGCQQTHGTALAYRLSDNRAVLVRTDICGEAQQTFADPQRRPYADERSFRKAISEQETLDLLRVCHGTIQGPSRGQMYAAPAFLLDDADRPAHWWSFHFGDTVQGSVVRLVSANAQALYAEPADDLDGMPGLLDSSFKYKLWINSPDSLISFDRRNARPHRFSNQVVEN